MNGETQDSLSGLVCLWGWQGGTGWNINCLLYSVPLKGSPRQGLFTVEGFYPKSAVFFILSGFIKWFRTVFLKFIM